jgi:hypothetical protein
VLVNLVLHTPHKAGNPANLHSGYPRETRAWRLGSSAPRSGSSLPRSVSPVESHICAHCFAVTVLVNVFIHVKHKAFAWSHYCTMVLGDYARIHCSSTEVATLASQMYDPCN